ncbi:hypothetical protein N9L68_00865 [bacterium]|nr:hypothetical protein [bacterium]
MQNADAAEPSFHAAGHVAPHSTTCRKRMEAAIQKAYPDIWAKHVGGKAGLGGIFGAQWQSNLLGFVKSLNSSSVSDPSAGDVDACLDIIRKRPAPPSATTRSKRQKNINTFKAHMKRAREWVDEVTGTINWALHEDLVAAFPREEADILWASCCFGREQAWVGGRPTTCAESVGSALKRRESFETGLRRWKEARRVFTSDGAQAMKEVDAVWADQRRKAFEATLTASQPPARESPRDEATSSCNQPVQIPPPQTFAHASQPPARESPRVGATSSCSQLVQDPPRRAFDLISVEERRSRPRWADLSEDEDEEVDWDPIEEQ